MKMPSREKIADNGSGLHVVYGEDSCHLVEEG